MDGANGKIVLYECGDTTGTSRVEIQIGSLTEYDSSNNLVKTVSTTLDTIEGPIEIEQTDASSFSSPVDAYKVSYTSSSSVTFTFWFVLFTADTIVTLSNGEDWTISAGSFKLDFSVGSWQFEASTNYLRIDGQFLGASGFTADCNCDSTSGFCYPELDGTSLNVGVWKLWVAEPYELKDLSSGDSDSSLIGTYSCGEATFGSNEYMNLYFDFGASSSDSTKSIDCVTNNCNIYYDPTISNNYTFFLDDWTQFNETETFATSDVILSENNATNLRVAFSLLFILAFSLFLVPF